MRSAVALLVLGSLTAGCFPHEPRKRTFAQLAEGGAVVAGIALEAVTSTGADCDMMGKIGQAPDPNCHTRSALYGNIGVALILGGLIGFVATISTAEDPKEPPKVDIKAEKPTEKLDVKLPPGVTAPPKDDDAKPTATVATPPADTQPAPTTDGSASK